ncbi:MAG: hypothetical protein ACOC5S_05085 [Acidobacteriota bacterium]
MIFAAAAVSFTLQQKQASPYAEPIKTYAAAGTPNLEIKYPKKWHLKEAQGLPSGKWGADISLPAQDKKGETDKTAAFIHFKWVDQNTGEKPEEVLDHLKEDFEGIPVTFDRLTLEADLDSTLEAPLGKLKKWETTLSGTQAEISLLVWPQSSGYLALGLLTPHSQVRRYTWMHAWRVFEVVSSDLIKKQLPLIRTKNLNLPLKAELTNMAACTMTSFSQAVIKEDFSRFYDGLAPIFQASTIPKKLLHTFRRFKEREELKDLEQYALSLDQPIRIDGKGFLALSGHFSSRPELTCFELTYKHTQNEWKLISIHVFLKDRDEK